MHPPDRNFLAQGRLHAGQVSVEFHRRPQTVFSLRSLPPLLADASPRRFSSSSLPPSFVSGRFAGFFIPAQPATPVQGV